MTEQIVDILESVQIDEQHGTSQIRRRGGERAVEKAGEFPPIRQTSQVVGGGVMPRLDEVPELMERNDAAEQRCEQRRRAEANGVAGHVDRACGDEDRDSEQAGHDRHGQRTRPRDRFCIVPMLCWLPGRH